MVAVAHGGSLYQDIYKQGATRRHEQKHKIGVTGKIANYLPTDFVNSYHHQAVRTLPDGFKVLARSVNDHVIEAIWKPGVLGVQWHPELLFPTDPRWHGLFRWFAQGLQ